MAFDGIPIIGLTAPALLGIFVLMIFLRKLVPEATYKEKIEEAEKWRLAYEAEREARAVSDGQTGELLELAKTSHQIMVAVFGASVGRSGGPHALPTSSEE